MYIYIIIYVCFSCRHWYERVPENITCNKIQHSKSHVEDKIVSPPVLSNKFDIKSKSTEWRELILDSTNSIALNNEKAKNSDEISTPGKFDIDLGFYLQQSFLTICGKISSNFLACACN